MKKYVSFLVFERGFFGYASYGVVESIHYTRSIKNLFVTSSQTKNLSFEYWNPICFTDDNNFDKGKYNFHFIDKFSTYIYNVEPIGKIELVNINNHKFYRCNIVLISNLRKI